MGVQAGLVLPTRRNGNVKTRLTKSVPEFLNVRQTLFLHPACKAHMQGMVMNKEAGRDASRS
jgi:hypothetical protein